MKHLHWPTKRNDAHASFTFTAGIIHCGTIRDYLEAQRLDGLDFEWQEGRGWFRREWVVRGSPPVIRRLHAALKEIYQ